MKNNTRLLKKLDSEISGNQDVINKTETNELVDLMTRFHWAMEQSKVRTDAEKIQLASENQCAPEPQVQLDEATIRCIHQGLAHLNDPEWLRSKECQNGEVPPELL